MMISTRKMICWRPNSRFLAARTGRRFMRIMASPLALVRLAQCKPDGHGRRGGDVHHVVGIEAAVVDLDALERIQDLDRNADALFDDLEERGNLGRTARQVETRDVRV